LKRTWPRAISRSAVTAGLLSQLDEGPRARRQLTRALGAEDHEGETIGDLFQAIFDGYASHGTSSETSVGLRGRDSFVKTSRRRARSATGRRPSTSPTRRHVRVFRHFDRHFDVSIARAADERCKPSSGP
jgi:hypothetical protein